MRTFLVILGLCMFRIGSEAADRIFVDATVNGRTARFVFDSGANAIAILPDAGKRLGLKSTNAPPGFASVPGGSRLRFTEPCDLTALGATLRTMFLIQELPAHVSRGDLADGLLGWPFFSCDGVLEINAEAGTVKLLDAVPAEAATWTRLRVLTNAEVLAVEISVPGGKAAVIVDTGAYQGVELCPDRWREWRAMHAKQPITLNAFYFLPVGQVVKEEGWASVLSLGPMIFNDVPVMEMPATNAPVGPIPNEAILGLAALKRLEVIVDVGNGVAYVRPKNTVPSPYDHNRLGAVFVPRDLRSSDLVARVAEDSPAWKAGVRDGDLLLKVDGSAATTWRADPAVLELVQFWQRPAGSEFKLTLKRGRKTFDARVVLRDILSPDGK